MEVVRKSVLAAMESSGVVGGGNDGENSLLLLLFIVAVLLSLAIFAITTPSRSPLFRSRRRFVHGDATPMLVVLKVEESRPF